MVESVFRPLNLHSLGSHFIDSVVIAHHIVSSPHYVVILSVLMNGLG